MLANENGSMMDQTAMKDTSMAALTLHNQPSAMTGPKGETPPRGETPPIGKFRNDDDRARTPDHVKAFDTAAGFNPQDLEKAEFEGLRKFSLSENKLDKSFCTNFCAVMIKRCNSYRRSKKRVLCEILLPSAFMIFGVFLSSVDFSFRSESRLFTPELYPYK